MPSKGFIYGSRKKWIEFRLIIRLLFSATFYFGFFKAFKEIKRYLRDTRSLFKTNPNRYVRSGKFIYVVPDMPPVNTKQFVKYIIRDIEWINNNKRPPLIFAIFCISSRCPYQCKYCYNSDMHSTEEKLELNTIIKAISQLIETGINNIYLSGGEPMMRWYDLIKILKEFKNSKTGFWLLSTGWELDPKKLKELKEYGLKGVMISLDSFNADQINQVKGSPKAFENASNTIKNASNAGLITAIDCVFGKSLLQKKNFRKFIETAGVYGAHFINCYSPRQMHHILENEYQTFQLVDFEKLDVLTKENQSSKSYSNLPITYSPDLWEAKRGCVGGKLFIYIDPEGNVKMCPFVNHSFGNIKEKRISVIIDNMWDRKLDNVCLTNQLLSEK